MTLGWHGIGSACAGTGNAGRVDACEAVREAELPPCVRDVLEEARAARPEAEVICIAFRTLEDEHEIARMGPDPALVRGGTASQLQAKNLLVFSATVTLTSFEAVHTVTHVLVTRISVRSDESDPL